MAEGERLTEYQALQALLLPSADNIADTLARWAFGSDSGYLDYANSLAATLGLRGMRVTDPSGLDPGTVASARDLVTLGEDALANPVVREIVAQPSATIPVQGYITNVNTFLGRDGVIGIKTGNNDQDPGVFLAAAEHQIGGVSVTIVAAVEGAPDLPAAMTAAAELIDSAVPDFASVSPNTILGTYSTPWKTSASVVCPTCSTLPIWRGDATAIDLHLTAVSAPMSAGTKVGNLEVQFGSSQPVRSRALVLAGRLPAPSDAWRYTHLSQLQP